MAQDKFSATWVSHTSISDFLKCPRAYYLNNVYKDPNTGHKVKIMSPALALGQAVHEVIESLSIIKTTERLKLPLLKNFDSVWSKVSGIKGGFIDDEQEHLYKNRGIAMIQRVIRSPGPISRLAVKIKQDLPHFWLSETDNIILCGKIDWLEYLPDQNAVHIIDFKTSKNDEDSNSLQLPIYYLLVSKCQERKVIKASYWYLERNDELTAKDLPDDLDAECAKLLTIAKEIKLARKLNRLKCPQGDGGCRACKPLEAILKHDARFVGVNEYNQDIYILESSKNDQLPQSEIL